MTLRWTYCELLLLAALGLAVSEQAEHTPKVCSNLVPGLGRMTLGIDITSFDLYSSENEGLMHQVIQYTCNRGRTKIIDGKVYDIPDQVGSVTKIPRGISNSVVDIVRTHAESRKSVSANLEVGGIFKWFGFSLSASLVSMQNTIFNKSSYVERVWAYKSAHRAHLIPDFMLKIHKYVENYVDNYLPPEFIPESAVSQDPYMKFIQYFGTHYFVNANFGGMLMANMETESKYYQTNDVNEVKLEGKASFFRIFGAGGGVSRSSAWVNSSFQSMTALTAQYVVVPSGV